MAEAGDIRVGINARRESIPPGYEWKKISEIVTRVRGGTIVTPKWQVVAIGTQGNKPSTKVVAGVGVAALVAMMFWGI